MPKTAMIRARAEPDLKTAAEDVLSALGLTPTPAITRFYREIVRERGIPFPLRLHSPTAEETRG
jgi:DNA-damage-inducible protein J